LVRRGPRLFPLALLVLLIAALAPGTGFVFLALLQGFLVFALVAGLATMFAAHRFRRRMHQHWQLTRRYHQGWTYPL
jgi:membrane protein implicated in regulation of membrane protease activity